MSDDLVKRLRDPAFGTETTERNLMSSAADRIEELEAKLSNQEALLALAVELAVLEALHAAASEANYACGCKDAIYAINPAHLAELKGESNETHQKSL
jgi:hypothetical protein